MPKKSLAEAFKSEALRSNTLDPAPSADPETMPTTLPTEVEMVPGSRGESLPADQLVSMTFKVTAKERYLWNLELSRQGKTAVSVLRSAMNALADEKSVV